MAERRAPRPVGVIGPGADDATERQVREAWLVGRGLALAGVPVICGGLHGVMDGVARGVRAGGGDVTGVVPGTDVSIANEHLTHVIAACGAGEMRNQVIVASSAALVVVGMNPGTAIEVLMAVSSKLDRPAFGVGVEGLSSGSLRLDSMTLLQDADDDPAWAQAVRAATAVATGRAPGVRAWPASPGAQPEPPAPPPPPASPPPRSAP